MLPESLLVVAPQQVPWVLPWVQPNLFKYALQVTVTWANPEKNQKAGTETEQEGGQWV